MAFIAYDREVAKHDVHWPTTWGTGRQMRVKSQDVVCFDAACWADTQTATRTVKERPAVVASTCANCAHNRRIQESEEEESEESEEEESEE